jgi:hypothetical protein
VELTFAPIQPFREPHEKERYREREEEEAHSRGELQAPGIVYISSSRDLFT